MITEYIQNSQVKEYEEAGWNVTPITGKNGTNRRFIAVRSDPEIERGRIAHDGSNSKELSRV